MAKETTFTIRRLKDAEYQGDKSNFFLYDSKTPGLRLKITKAGFKSFQFYKWSPQKQAPVTITIGAFTGDNLDAARKKAIEFSNDMTLGIDVQEQKNKAKNEKTFDYYALKFFENQRHLGKKDVRNIEGRYRYHIKPHFGGKKISWFTEEKITKWFHGLLDKKTERHNRNLSPATANRCLKIVKQVFNQKILKHVDNPAADVEQFKEYSRSRYVRPDELNRLLGNLDNVSPMFADVFRLALFTGARRANLLAMRWRDIDFDSRTWTIQGEDSKNSEYMTVPLLEDAIALLDQIKEGQRNNSMVQPYVFPSTGKTGHLTEISRQWKKLKKLSGITDDLRFHDLRRSVGSYMAQSGQPLNIIGSLLGHRNLATTEIYARLNAKSTAKSLEIGFRHMMQQAEESEEEQKIVNIKKGE